MQSAKKGNALISNIRRYPWLYIMILPVIAFYIIFCYWPMYGVIIAFQDFVPAKGIFGSNFVGFDHFISFFTDFNFSRLISNTVMINLQMLVFGFPLPILFALLLNEMRSSKLRKITQTITYMPHFVSSVVVCGLVVSFTKSGGLITSILTLFGLPDVNLLSKAELFQPIYVSMNIWQEFGWDSIIFFAALTGIDPAQYEAATLDGAGRWKRMWYITLPGLLPTISILLILRMGNIMSLGWDKIVLLYSPTIYETSDVISTYVYRRGLIQYEYSYAAAVGLFNSVINVFFLVGANFLSRKVNETSLW